MVRLRRNQLGISASYNRGTNFFGFWFHSKPSKNIAFADIQVGNQFMGRVACDYRGFSRNKPAGCQLTLRGLSGTITLSFLDESGFNVASHRVLVKDVQIQSSGISYVCPSGNSIVGWLCAADAGPHINIQGIDLLREGKTVSCDFEVDFVNYPHHRLLTYRLLRPEKIKAQDTLRIHLTSQEVILQELGPEIRAQKEVQSPSKHLNKLRDKFLGDTVWIIGNGPSVDLQDLERIPKNSISFCFNRFHLSYPNHSFRPSFTLASDTSVLLDFGEEIIGQAGGKIFFAGGDKRTGHLASGYTSVPMAGPGSLFIADVPVFSEGGSAPFIAIQLAVFMGFKQILLYGFDMDFKIGDLALSQENKIVATNDNNHFITNYRSGKSWHPPNLGVILQAFLNTEVSSHFLSFEVINLSRGGKLEVFARKEFDTYVN